MTQKIDIFIDSNVWNYFLENNFDFDSELPPSTFKILISREVEIEIDNINDSKLKNFINENIEKYNIKTHAYFGFYDDTRPDELQTSEGFSSYDDFDEKEGSFISIEEAELFCEEAHLINENKKRPTQLYKNETDVMLSTRSVNSVVLSIDSKGSLKRAKNNKNRKVINPKDCPDGILLGDFIKNKFQ